MGKHKKMSYEVKGDSVRISSITPVTASELSPQSFAPRISEVCQMCRSVGLEKNEN